jgi:hypothetical protein
LLSYGKINTEQAKNGARHGFLNGALKRHYDHFDDNADIAVIADVVSSPSPVSKGS